MALVLLILTVPCQFAIATGLPTKIVISPESTIEFSISKVQQLEPLINRQKISYRHIDDDAPENQNGHYFDSTNFNWL